MKKEMIEKNTNKKGPLVTNFSDENGWSQWEGNWYFNINGVMQSNYWEHDPNNGLWYYMGSNGAMVTNQWVQDKGQWYYMGSSGAMVTNDWQQDKGQWYYLGSNGAMVTDQWVEDKGKSYYLGSNGAMVSGSSNINSPYNSGEDDSITTDMLSYQRFAKIFGLKGAVNTGFSGYVDLMGGGTALIQISFGDIYVSNSATYTLSLNNGNITTKAGTLDNGVITSTFDFNLNGFNLYSEILALPNGSIKVSSNGFDIFGFTIISDLYKSSIGTDELSVSVKVTIMSDDDDNNQTNTQTVLSTNDDCALTYSIAIIALISAVYGEKNYGPSILGLSDISEESLIAVV